MLTTGACTQRDEQREQLEQHDKRERDKRGHG
jgi:hypothetical protein